MGQATQDPYERYKRWHWGEEADLDVEWGDPDYPKTMIGIGNLHELHVRPLSGQGDTDELVMQEGQSCWIAFDPTHKYERLYLLLSDDVRKDVQALLLQEDGEWWDLAELSRAAGGKQSKLPYPSVEVQPIGQLTNVVYFTKKTGDGLSQYIHEFGEDSGILPILAADRSGRLWVAGGNMTSPYAGITD
tara:strand:+ start:1261 stop:1827 length:567 start_codon:yes stop_codon:yes gene_type:complete